jgi:serine/threonine protein kinase
MGTVFAAAIHVWGRMVAIKLVNDVSTDDRARARLVREARHASSLNHPNICTIYDIGDADGQPFIAMEYVEGRPLTEVIPDGGLPLERTVALGVQIADAVGARPRPWHRASRLEAVECNGHVRGTGQDSRLRPRDADVA